VRRAQRTTHDLQSRPWRSLVAARRTGLLVWGLITVGGPVALAVIYGIFKLHSLAVIWLTLKHAPDAEVHAGVLHTRVKYRTAGEIGRD
jgi:hypothetical protein